MTRAAGLLAILAVFLMLPGGASAAGPCPTSFQDDIDSAVDGAVVVAPLGECEVNLTTTNTNAFTIKANPGGTTLDAATSTQPIIKSVADVRYTIDGITFTGESGSQPAILIEGDGAAATIKNSTFRNNVGGSALEILTGASTTTQPTVIQNNTFTNNSGGSDGAIDLGGAGGLVLSGNTFTANSSGFAGGGVSISNGAGSGTNPLVVTGNTFGGPNPADGNVSFGAGGGLSLSASHDQPVTITNNTFQNNQIAGTGTSHDRVGAGLVVAVHDSDSAFEVQQSGNRFIGNVISATAAPGPPTPLGEGGAGEWVSGAHVHSTDDVFQGNQITVNDGAPPEGGALGVLGLPAIGSVPAQPGIFVGTNDLFTGNSLPAGGWGGAVYIGGPVFYCPTGCPGSSLTLNDSTLTGNTVAGGEGGALWGSSNDSLVVNNSIVTGNDAGPGQPDVFGFSAPAVQFSDVCTSPGGATPLAGSGNICANPLLGADGTETLSSPTADAGSNALVPAGLTTDLAGAPRIQAHRAPCSGPGPAIVDMGAFEAGLAPLPTCVPIPPLALGKLRAGANGVTITIRCTLTTTCKGVASLFTTEHKRGRKVLSLSRKRTRKRTVLVGRKSFRLAAGKSLKLSVPLDHTGKKLLTRFKRLPVRLKVKVQTSGGNVTLSGPRTTIKARHHRKHRR